MEIRRTLISIALLATALISNPSWSVAPTPGKITKERFTFGDRTITYYLFVPKGVTAPASAPMVVLLHGSGRDGSSLVEPWKTLAEKEGIVLVGPDAQSPQGWYVPTDGPAALCALLDSVRQSLPVVNPRRMYLFGHSAGAVFVLYMATLESNYFAAAALHAGAWRAPEEFTSIDALERKIPMSLAVGDSDRFFPVADVNATAAALKKAGVPVETQIIPNHDHNYYVISGKVNDWVWAALKGHELAEDPRYTPRQFR